MAVGTVIIDPLTGKRIKLGAEGQLVVQVDELNPGIPPPGTHNRLQYLKGRLGSIDIEEGNVSQDVNGAGTQQIFQVKAHNDYDIHIYQITWFIADGSVVMDKFGSVGPLSTGWDLVWTESGTENYIIEKATTGGEVLVQSGTDMIFGDSSNLQTVPNYTASGDAMIINFPVRNFMRHGLRLGRGTLDTLESRINDNLTGLDEMYVYVFGEKRYP